MAIHHASSGELIDIRTLQDNLITAATKTLFQSNHTAFAHVDGTQVTYPPPADIPRQTTLVNEGEALERNLRS